MIKRLTSIFLFLALLGGVASGMPLHSAKAGGEMMDCCEKANGHDETPAAQMARVCCAVNCSDSAPTAPAAAFDYAPSTMLVGEALVVSLARLLAAHERRPARAAPALERAVTPRKIPPKYIRHKSFLI